MENRSVSGGRSGRSGRSGRGRSVRGGRNQQATIARSLDFRNPQQQHSQINSEQPLQHRQFYLQQPLQHQQQQQRQIGAQGESSSYGYQQPLQQHRLLLPTNFVSNINPASIQTHFPQMLPPTFSQLLNETQDNSQQAYDQQYGFFDNTQRSFPNEDGSNYFAQGEAGEEEEEAEYYGEEEEEEEAGDDNSKGKGAKAEGSNKRWEHFEDIILCTCWCNKTDSTWDTKSDKYWSLVTDMYNMDVQAKGGMCRDVKALKNRWYRTIRAQGMLWSASSKKVRALVKSGENEYKIMQRIEERYRRDHPSSKSFKLMHCIDILMESQKFAATCTTGTYPSFKDMDLGDDDDDENVETPKQGSNSVSNSASTQSSGKRTRESTSNVVNSPVKRTRRPPGVKKTKAQLKFDAELPERTATLEAMTAARSAEMELERMKIEAFGRKVDVDTIKAKAKLRRSVQKMLDNKWKFAATDEARAEALATADAYYAQWKIEDGI